MGVFTDIAVPFVPTIAPAQPSTGPDVPKPTATTASTGTPPGSGLPIPSSFLPPTSGYGSGISDVLGIVNNPEVRKGLDQIAQQVRSEFGDYNVQPPAPSAYQSGLSPWTMLGAFLSGYPGSYGQGALFANQNKLAAQKDYDQALRAYQQGRATWQTDLARATNEAQSSYRGLISSLMPYMAYKGGDVLNAYGRAYTAGLAYFSKEAVLSYDYFREANLEQYRGQQIEIRQDSNRIRQAYQDLNIAIRQQNQQLAQDKWGLLQQEIRTRMKHEQTLTDKIIADSKAANPYKAQSALHAVQAEIDRAYHQYAQDAAASTDPHDPTVEAEKVHITFLEQQELAWNRRVQELGLPAAPNPDGSPAAPPHPAAPGSAGGTAPNKYTPGQVMQAINNMTHVGLTREQIHQRLQESGLNPADWGY